MARLIIFSIAILWTVNSTLESPLYSDKALDPPKTTLKVRIVRRQCVEAIPNVSKDDILGDVCSENSESDRTACINELTAYIQQSVLKSCTHYSNLYNDCLATVSQTKTSCSDAELGLRDCSAYALQTYAYCGCYYSTPVAMYECVNVELNVGSESINPNASTLLVATLPASSALSEVDNPVTTPTSLVMASSIDVISGTILLAPSPVPESHTTITHPVTYVNVTPSPSSLSASSLLAGTQRRTTTITTSAKASKTSGSPTRADTLPVVTTSLRSASPSQYLHSFSGPGDHNAVKQATKGQQAILDAKTTVSRSLITIDNPAPTATHASEMKDSNPPSGTSASYISQPERTSLVPTSMQSPVCTRRARKRSMIMVYS